MFDAKAATAIAVFFLRNAPGHVLNDLRLMKLAYLAERESITEQGASLTGAKLYSMPNGPVLSELLRLMHSEIASDVWETSVRFIPRNGKESNRCVLLEGATFEPESYLSDYELGLLGRIWETYKDKSKWELVDLTHDFPEWDADVLVPGKPKRIELPVKDIFIKGLSFPEDVAEARASDIEYYQAVH